MLHEAFFRRDAASVAHELIGATLLVDGVGGTIVETEAYDRADPASHSVSGPTRRNAAMFGPIGRAYVYRSYGIHWCLNLVCGVEPGSAVLIRALQPTSGLDRMQARRGTEVLRDLCRGPGRLCQALAVTGTLDHHRLDRPPFEFRVRAGPVLLTAGRRIGITRGVETPWRFCLAGSRFVSRTTAGPRSEPGL